MPRLDGLLSGSVNAARESLLMSAYWKIPLQALVLIIGVFMFLFYVFTPPPRCGAEAFALVTADWRALSHRTAVGEKGPTRS